jgi:hypothetical protein
VPARIDTLARQYTTSLPPEDVAVLVGRVRAQAKRLEVVNDCPTPLDLAARFDPTIIRTPALELLARELVGTAHARDGRLIVSIGPQEGKSSLLRWFTLWMLIDDPDRRIVFASYAASLARSSGRIVRGLLDTHGTSLGLSVAADHADASDWQLAGHRGGMYTVGVGGSLTGKPSDVLVMDDVLRNQQDADSPVIKARLYEWWESVARTRLAPGSPAVIVGTRWSEDDLSGHLARQGWPVLNIPAYADGQTTDGLSRPVGEWLVSARGRTPADWEATKRDVGERAWAAMFQGRPAPLEGGVFKRAWFDTWRVDVLPAGCLPSTVVVDPADNEGDGDEAGIILATTQPATNRVFILDDLSAPMTVARWARVALLTCVRRDAPTLAYEQSMSQIPKKIREAWKTLHQQAVALHKAAMDPAAALSRLSRADDSTETRQAIEQGLAELTTADVAVILRVGQTGPIIHKITAKGSKESRMLWAAPEFETGRAVMVGRHPALEHQACFPAGTLVETDRGPLAIEAVATTDRVLTRGGWRAVLWSGQTTVAGCVEVRTSSGASLRATPDHRVWVDGHGWMSIKQVRVGHRMLECLSRAPVHPSPSKGLPTASTTTAITRPGRPEATRCGCSTVTCGRLRTAPSLTAGTCTTSTTTATTTTPPTSKPFPLRCTTITTHPIEGGARGAMNGVALRDERNGRAGNPLSARVSTAVARTSRLDSGRSTAPCAVASTTTGSESGNWSGPATVPPSFRTTTVVAVDLTPGPTEPVYDLTVADRHEFVAAGLLVHNCTWQQGMSSPDRVDALVHATNLANATAATLSRSTGDRVPTSSAAKTRVQSRMTRSTKR